MATKNTKTNSRKASKASTKKARKAAAHYEYNKKKGAGKKGGKKKSDRPHYEYACKVLRVFDGEYGVLFDVEINHVILYGCRICTNGSTGEAFIGFPQKKGAGRNARYWNVAYAYLDDDQQADVLEQIDTMLAEDEDEDEPEDDEDEDEDEDEDDEGDEPY